MLVALNSVFQIVMFGVLGWFHLVALPGRLDLPVTDVSFSTWDIVKSVLVFLGIPLLAGYLTRRFGEEAKGGSTTRRRSSRGSGRSRSTDCCSPSCCCSP